MPKNPETRGMLIKKGTALVVGVIGVLSAVTGSEVQADKDSQFKMTSYNEAATVSFGKTLLADCEVVLEPFAYCQKTKAEADIEKFTAAYAEAEEMLKQQQAAEALWKAAEEKAKQEQLAAEAAQQKLVQINVDAPAPQPAPQYPVGCDLYLDTVDNYPWPVDQAMLTMSEESGCNPNAVSDTNDHGLFQLHDQPVYDPVQNIAIAYSKWEAGRIGDHNFSAWYAVCTPGDNPQPKFAGIDCN